jgi:single-strand DNA-binding protein
MGQEKGENSAMSYLNSVTLVGFVGADPEQRQARGNGSKFTVLSVATQRSWKNTEDEWVSKTEWHRISIFRPRLAEYALTAIKKGAHILVEGSLVSSTYDRPNGKGKKATAEKIISWTIRADVIRKLDRSEIEPETVSAQSSETPASDAPPF